MPDITPPPQPELKVPPTSPSPQATHVLDDELRQSEEQKNSPAPKNTMKAVISTVALFLAAPLLALFLILFVIQSYEVDGPSMEETLQNKDLLIVSKVPVTWSKITRNPYNPPRYDIIIFSRDEGAGQTRQLVKRVIGLPGERVVVKDGKVTVYNQQNPDGFDPDANQEYSKTIKTTPGTVDITVKDDQVFVMGDNRTNSLDSRYFGPVNDEEIVGELGARIFPLNKAERF